METLCARGHAPESGCARAEETLEAGPAPGSGGDRGPHDRAHLLGESLVREPRALQRLLESSAARAHVRAQRLGGGSHAESRQGRRARERIAALPGGDRGDAALQGALEGALQGLRRWYRFGGRAAAGPLRARRHGAPVPPEDRTLSGSCRDSLLLHLSRLGLDVQARRGHALRRRGATRRAPRTLLRAAPGGGEGPDRRGR